MENQLLRIDVVGSAACLWRYTVKSSGRALNVQPPVFELDGKATNAVLSGPAKISEPLRLANGASEFTCTGELKNSPGTTLETKFQISPDNPVVRFQYRLSSTSGARLTKKGNQDQISYLRLALPAETALTEVRLSDFDEAVHAYRLVEERLPARAFSEQLSFGGPLLTFRSGQEVGLAAYEHGVQVPEAFLRFRLFQDGSLALQAARVNYLPGQTLAPERPFESVWLELALMPGAENELAASYRQFVLKYLSLYPESRKPYIFYNTWSRQERTYWWKKQKFTTTMNERDILAEIEIAARMGIEVFVIDAGWHEGDWLVSPRAFPNGLRPIKQRLDQLGMKMGLWFAPTLAQAGGKITQDHGDCRYTVNGQVAEPRPTGELRMCLVSRYADAFVERVIELAREAGVTYFKWDGIDQYSCDAADHLHGGPDLEPGERAARCAYELPLYLSRLAGKVCRAIPGAIVDFDVTEGQRSMGLNFLTVGKYFLINNGPYYANLDFPDKEPFKSLWSNPYVYPGPWRARVCRSGLDFDKWIPSILLLTHYLPDDPESSQWLNVASLVLGQNGIWGDLPEVSSGGIELFAKTLSAYKQVRDDLTVAAPVRTGIPGGSPEVHEKINPLTGRGGVAIFAGTKTWPGTGVYTYLTAQRAAQPYWHSPNVTAVPAADGRARITLHADAPGAGVVFFGASA